MYVDFADYITLGLFIIDGVITIPIALLGFLIMPDLPTTTKPSIFLSEAHLEIGKRRMEEVGRKPPSHFTKKKVSYLALRNVDNEMNLHLSDYLLRLHLAFLDFGTACVTSQSVLFNLTDLFSTVYILVSRDRRSGVIYFQRIISSTMDQVARVA